MMHMPLRASATLLFAFGAHAQGVPRLDPVHWSAEALLPKASPAGSRFTVLLHAAIDTGWHLYALQERDAVPLATEIALASNPTADLLRVAQARPQHRVDPESHLVTAWFTQTALFTLRLASTTQQGPRDLQVLVRYQACNDRMCLPLKNETVPVTIALTR